MYRNEKGNLVTLLEERYGYGCESHCIGIGPVEFKSIDDTAATAVLPTENLRSEVVDVLHDSNNARLTRHVSRMAVAPWLKQTWLDNVYSACLDNGCLMATMVKSGAGIQSFAITNQLLQESKRQEINAEWLKEKATTYGSDGIALNCDICKNRLILAKQCQHCMQIFCNGCESMHHQLEVGKCQSLWKEPRGAMSTPVDPSNKSDFLSIKDYQITTKHRDSSFPYQLGNLWYHSIKRPHVAQIEVTGPMTSEHQAMLDLITKLRLYIQELERTEGVKVIYYPPNFADTIYNKFVNGQVVDRATFRRYVTEQFQQALQT